MLKNLGPIEIMKYQQNRHPLLFLDLVLEAEPRVRAKALKSFSFNEWFFPAHFQDEPVVPGFVLVESMTQAFLMTFLTDPEFAGRKTAFVEISQARFLRKVIPGETLLMDAVLSTFAHGLAEGRVVATVEDQLACEVQLKIAIPEILKSRLPRSRMDNQS